MSSRRRLLGEVTVRSALWTGSLDVQELGSALSDDAATCYVLKLLWWLQRRTIDEPELHELNKRPKAAKRWIKNQSLLTGCGKSPGVAGKVMVEYWNENLLLQHLSTLKDDFRGIVPWSWDFSPYNLQDMPTLTSLIKSGRWDTGWIEAVAHDLERRLQVEAMTLGYLSQIPIELQPEEEAERYLCCRGPSSRGNWTEWAQRSFRFLYQCDLARRDGRTLSEMCAKEHTDRLVAILSGRTNRTNVAAVIGSDARLLRLLVQQCSVMLAVYFRVLQPCSLPAACADFPLKYVHFALPLIARLPSDAEAIAATVRKLFERHCSKEEQREAKLRWCPEDEAEEKYGAHPTDDWDYEDFCSATKRIWDVAFRNAPWPERLRQSPERMDDLLENLRSLYEYCSGENCAPDWPTDIETAVERLSWLVTKIREIHPDEPKPSGYLDLPGVFGLEPAILPGELEMIELERQADEEEAAKAAREREKDEARQLWERESLEMENERQRQRDQEEREEWNAERERRRQDAAKEAHDNSCREANQALTDSLRQQEQWSQWIGRGP